MAAAPKLANDTISRIRRDWATEIDKIYAKHRGVHPVDQIHAEITAFARTKDLNGYAAEIAHAVTIAEQHARQVHLDDQKDLFPDEAKRMLIRLGPDPKTGRIMQVRAYDATALHWRKHQRQQVEAAQATLRASNRTDDIATEIESFGDPTMTTAIAYRKLGKPGW